MNEPKKLPLKGREVGPLTTARAVGDTAAIIEDLGPIALTGPSGVVFSATSAQLHCNLTVLGAGESIESHVNDEVDVLMIVLSGTGEVVVDGETSLLTSDVLALIQRGSVRSVRAQTRLTYHSIHQRR